MTPHRHPFRLVEPASTGRLVLQLSASSVLLRGDGALGQPIALEILAQAAALVSGRDEVAEVASEELGVLAALDQVRFAPELAIRPLAAGDILEARVEPVASFGRLRKVRGELLREGSVVVTAELLLASGGAPGAR